MSVCRALFESLLPLLLALSTLTACDRTLSLKLPPTPDRDLAFAILYDGDRVAEIGPVTRRQTLYAGRYGVRSADRGLEARVFFVLLSDLIEASRAACASLPEVVDRTACAALVSTCEEAPERCLLVARASEGCGGRIPLAPELPLAGFRADEESVESLPGERADALLTGAVACGPAARPPCPNRLPGFVVTEGGAIRCVAPAEQLECALTVDLSRCGLGEISGELSENGGFTGEGTACRVNGTTTEGTVGGKEGYVLACGERRFVASPMELSFGELGCRRRGSPVYNTSFSTPGVINGLAAFSPDGWTRRYVMSGFGVDDCANTGCFFRGSSCDRCNDTCDVQFDLPECRRNDWPACVGLDARAECLERCRQWCMRPDQGCADTAGLVLTLFAPDTPEQEVLRADLDSIGERAAASAQALVVINPDRVVVATDESVQLFRAAGADQLEVVDGVALPFTVTGVVQRPGTGDEVVAFGSDGAPPAGMAARLQLTGTPPTWEIAGEVSAAGGVAGFDVAAASQGWLYAASTRPPADTEPRAVIAALPYESGEPETVDLGPGRITALAALPDGTILAGIATASGGRLALLVPGVSAVERTIDVPLPDGLSPSALAPDPMLEDRVFIGLERTSASEPALIGLFSRGPNGGEPRFLPAMVETAESELSLLFVDRATGTLMAVARHRNVISPILLLE